jgi:uncharacterized protein YjdB
MGRIQDVSKAAVSSAALVLLLSSCGGGGGGNGSVPPPTPLYGATAGLAEKGPLITGSTVTAQELDANLSPTGKQYSYQINSDLGDFSPTSNFTSRFIGSTATGYYFDEVLGTVSSGPVTLNGYNDLSVETVLNVNILTTLAYQRIRTLMVQSGKSFSDARTQAEGEVLTALKIPGGAYGSFGTLKLGGNNAGAQILAAVSSLFVQDSDAGEVSQLINNFQNDLGTDGLLDNAVTRQALDDAAINLDPAAIAQHLNQRFASAGVTFQADDIAKWIDRNGDGIVGDYHFEVIDANASTSHALPAEAVAALNGRTISMNSGSLVVNGVVATGPVTVHTGDAISVVAGTFQNGMASAWINAGSYTGVIRVSFLAPLNSIEVSPQGGQFIVGEQQAFTATAHFQDGSTGDVSSFIRWQSSAPQVASVDETGSAEALAVGTSTITAAYSTYSGTSDFQVVAVRLDAFAIAPMELTTGIGIAQRPRATGSYSDGSTRDITDLVTWSTNDAQVASVDAHSGVISGVALGSTVIDASVDALVGSVTVDVTANGVSAAPSISGPRRSHSATLLTNGKVLIVGSEGDPTDRTAELYDPATATWTSAGTMANWHGVHEAILLADGRVLIVGGIGSGPAVPFAELYDPMANQWSPAMTMALPRTSHTATLLSNGTVLVVGGNEGLGPVYTSTVLYDPATNTWSERASLGTPRKNHAATRLSNGKVLVTGGWDAIGPVPVSSVTATAELYDPAANTWAPVASMSHARLGHTATLLSDGRVLVVGGTNAIDLLAAEIYDPVSNTWSPAGTMTTPRMRHTPVLLPNGLVMVAGGSVDQPLSAGLVSTETVEVYDPATNAWSPAPDLSVPRSGHTATLLGNHAVLFVGGGNEIPPYMLDSTELYW